MPAGTPGERLYANQRPPSRAHGRGGQFDEYAEPYSAQLRMHHTAVPQWDLCLECDPSVDVRDGVTRQGSLLKYGEGDEVRIPDCCGTRYVVIWVTMEGIGTERKWKRVYLLRHSAVFPGTQYTGGACGPVFSPCPCSPIPRSLDLTAVNIAGCVCLDGVTGVINYNDAENDWQGSLSFPCGDGTVLNFTMACSPIELWQFFPTGCVTSASAVTTVDNCSPITIRSDTMDTHVCCDPPGSGTFFLRVTERL